MIGTTISHFNITAKLGEGGMGEVWRAEDTKLDREVAIKLLPEAFTEDPERLARFEREAKLLAQLHHPHIASIFGLEESDGVRALVMELVEGQTLAERLEQGPMGLEDCLTVARQIAVALEVAHAKGIVHRDLKPQNIKLTPEGKVKVLDFGLAKAMDPMDEGSASSVELTHSPTMTLGGTMEGVILGTAAYMSPEQAKGQAVDKRADIWAFGVVLYEMLTRSRLFKAATVPETLAQVLERQPDLEALPGSVPRPVRRLLRRCLERDPHRRLHDIADARLELDDAVGRLDTEERPVVSTTGRRLSLATLVGAVIVALAAGVFVGLHRGSQNVAAADSASSLRLSVAFPDNAVPYVGWPGQSLALSPDGRDLVFACSIGADGRAARQLCHRPLGSFDVEPLEGTSGARQPFFSPDGDWVGFFTPGGGLQKISLETGRVLVVVPEVDAADWSFGTWGDDGRIVFSSWNSGLLSVSAEGGEVTVLVQAVDEWIENPEFLPGGGTVLYRVLDEDGVRIEALDVATLERRVVLEDASQPRFVAPDRLLLMRDGVLMTATFDPESVAIIGTPEPLAEDVSLDSLMSGDPIPQIGASRNGTLAFVAPRRQDEARSELIWIDRQGRETPAMSLSGRVWAIDLLADDSQAIVTTRRGKMVQHLLVDLERGTQTPISESRQTSVSNPVLVPGDEELLFAESVVEDVSIRRVGLDAVGDAEVVASVEGSYGSVGSISGDGRFVAFAAYRPGLWADLFYIDLEAPEPKTETFLASEASEHTPALSPDGRWIAYVSNETGEEGLYVQSFPDGGQKRRVSRETATDPQWSADGSELFFTNFGENGTTTLWAIPVERADSLAFGSPSRLFSAEVELGGDISRNYAVSRDGQRFLTLRLDGQVGLSRYQSGLFEIRVAPQWAQSLQRQPEAD